MTNELKPSRIPESELDDVQSGELPRGDGRADDAPPDHETPTSIRPDAIGKRFLSVRTLVSFGLALAILVFVFRGLGIDLGDAWARIREANVPLFLGALAVYYFTFVIRALRWTSMLARVGIDEEHGHPVPKLPGMIQIFLLSWFANCVVPARLGDAYRSYLIKQRADASFSVSLGTILAERLIDLVMLVAVLLGSGFIVFGTHAPDRARSTFLIGGVVVLIGIAGVAGLWLARERAERLLPARLTTHFRKLHTGLFLVLSRPTPYGLTSIVLWFCDGLRVYLIAWSLGQHISYPAAIAVALVSALVSIVPFTPAGLGVVEGFMVWALTQIDVPPGSAAAIALLDRFTTYGSLLIIGLPLYLWVLRRDIRESRENPD